MCSFSIQLQAPAKVNLFLKVINKRKDGYHDIFSLMAPITLFDEITISLSDTFTGIRLECDEPDLPCDQRNLAYRAAESFLKELGPAPGIVIRLMKHIPMAAGLGGGSSDAASVLLGLNRLFCSPLKWPSLYTLARRLGADVPFFLKGRPCLATGIGDILTPVPWLPDMWFLLITPGFPLSTATVYSGLKMQLTTPWITNINLEAIADPRVLVFTLENDLEAYSLAHYPILEEIKKTLGCVGARWVLMTGSGPTIFGIFFEEPGDEVLRFLDSKGFGRVFKAKLLKNWGVAKR